MLSERDEFLSFLARVAREGGLIIILGICAFLLLSLFSYNANDPGWSHLGTIDHTFNMAGPVGAWVADFLYAMLGIVAIVPPIMLLLLAFFGFRKSVDDVVSSIPFWTFRVIGAVIFVITAAALASLHFTSTSLQVPFGAGGMLGLSAAKYCADLFGLIGATLVLFTLWLLGVTLFTHLSWLALADRVGHGLLVAFHFLREQTQAILVKGVENNSRRKEDKKTAASAPDKSAKPAKQAKVEPVFDLGVGAATPEPAQSEKTESLFSMFASPAKESAASVPVLEVPLAAPAAEVLADAPVADKHLKIVPLSETVKPTQNDDDDEPYAASKPRRATKSNAKPLPDMNLLDKAEKKHGQGYTPEQLESMSRLLEAKLQDFGVQAEVVEVNPGPVITRFEIQPAPGTKVSKISNLSKDLARSMAVLSVRVVEVIAGKSVVGIEIPNEDREIVRLSEVLTSKAYSQAESKLSLALGNDIAGNPVVVNLAKMPHLLVAGTTGSGKSVGVNAMLLSLLYKATPEEVRLMMVDPKMLELSIYDGIPHLLTPVITDMKEAASGLRWCVAEMERRYRLMAKMGVRNLAGFNSKVREAQDAGQPIPDPLWNAVEEGFDENAPAPFLEPLPYIVVVIDEFADMMMIVGKKVEELIARIAQKARAAGIHLILATQRPSVDVITGLIKANVPTRIAFQVSSKIDSRTILDQGGAESLLGHGDMLYLPAGTSMPARVHGAFVADDEVHRVVEAWKKWGPPEFVEEILMANVDMDTTGGSAIGGGLSGEEEDPLYDEAVAFVTQTRRASISSVQRKLKIGYNRAARMVEVMEAAGVVSEAGNNGSREVLAPPPVGMD